jgi:hypothetical protein
MMMCADVINNGNYVRRRVTEIELPHIEVSSTTGQIKIMRKPYAGMKELKRKPSFAPSGLINLVRKLWRADA